MTHMAASEWHDSSEASHKTYFFQASPIHFRKYTHQVRSLGKIVYGSPRWRLPIKRSMANQKSLKRGTLGIKGIVTHIMHMAATGWHDSSKASHKAHFSGQPCLLLKGQYSPSSLPQKYPVPAQRNMLVSSYGTFPVPVKTFNTTAQEGDCCQYGVLGGNHGAPVPPCPLVPTPTWPFPEEICILGHEAFYLSPRGLFSWGLLQRFPIDSCPSTSAYSKRCSMPSCAQNPNQVA